MTTTRRCPACGSSLPADAPRGLCVECLMRLAEAPPLNHPLEDSDTTEEGTRNVRFGDYELLRQIGRGGMGVVYEARQISLHRIVALKMILGGDLASSSAVRRFRIEAEAAAKLAHPHIVAIHEFGESEGLTFFSMERIEGTSLDRKMAALALPCVDGNLGEKNANKSATRAAQERIAKLIITLARALHYAHEEGVVHCDVKPSNILVDSHGQPHLTDFGIARVLDHDGQLTASGVMGTPRYMSPEQAAGKRGEMTAATDVYGLGVVLYELLTGRTPFRGATPQETLRNVLERAPTSPQDSNPLVGRDLSIICTKCLEKNMHHRYGSAAELADDLERWLQREPILARPASSLEKLVRWCQRKPTIAALTSSVAFLLVTVAIVSTLFAFRLVEERKQREIALRERETALREREAVASKLRDKMNTALENLWNTSEEPSVLVDSETRAVLMEELLPNFETYPGEELRLTFGVYTFEKPIKMVGRFAGLLSILENLMANHLRRPVRIDYRIYRSYTLGHQGLLSGEEVDFMRLGPASYVLLKKRQPGISLLVAQQNFVNCVIFTRTNSGVASLSDLTGKAFAFGDPESTFGTYEAKLALLRAGLHANDLSTNSRHFRSHDDVFKAVMESDAYAAGAANVIALDTNQMRFLHGFPNIHVRTPLVVRSGIAPAVAQALKAALLDPVLTSLPLNLSGFSQVSDQEYDVLRMDLEEAEHFDQPVP